MSRYIDAEPLEQIAAAMINQYRQSGNEEYELPWHGKLLFVSKAPTADVAPVVHGRLIWTEAGNEDYEQYWVCSNCGDKTYFKTNYCQNCGAKMDLQVEQEVTDD